MGLVPTPEHGWVDESIEKAAEMAQEYLDLDKLLAIAREAPHLTDVPPTFTLLNRFPLGNSTGQALPLKTNASPPRIGIIRDAAFQFYYPENLEALEAAGADIVMVSALADPGLPSLDGLYIGGGFPETQAKPLAENKGFRHDVRRLAEKGLPIYAECGGLMYLGESLVLDNVTYPMVGVFPAIFGFSKRPEGHGYTIFEAERTNPYFEPGVQVRGHEFHYSKVLSWQGKSDDLAFRMIRGTGFDGKGDGLCYKNTLATYSHVHALGTPSWAGAMVKASVLYRGGLAATDRR